jgi:hypothetical protein
MLPSWKVAAATFVPAMLLAMAPAAHAAFILEIAPDASGNVDETGAGSIDTAGFTQFDQSGSASSVASVNGGNADAIAGPTTYTGVELGSGISGPTEFGTGSGHAADSGTGGIVGIAGADRDSPIFVVLPVGYISETPLADSAVFDNTTIAGLGLTPGVYVYTFGSGLTADSLTVDISSTPVPEASPIAALTIPLFVGLLVRRKRRSAENS